MKNILLVLILTLIYNFSFGQPEADKNKGLIQADSIDIVNVTNYDRYRSHYSFIEVQLQDSITEEKIAVILLNMDFAGYFFYDRRYKKKDRDTFFDRYIEYMVKNHGNTMITNINKFKYYMYDLKYDNYIVQNKMSLQNLQVDNKYEILEKYFTRKCGAYYLKEEYNDKYYNNAAFKALLIELGFDVSITNMIFWGSDGSEWCLAVTPFK